MIQNSVNNCLLTLPWLHFPHLLHSLRFPHLLRSFLDSFEDDALYDLYTNVGVSLSGFQFYIKITHFSNDSIFTLQKQLKTKLKYKHKQSIKQALYLFPPLANIYK